jgi:hypothetical protein
MLPFDEAWPGSVIHRRSDTLQAVRRRLTKLSSGKSYDPHTGCPKGNRILQFLVVHDHTLAFEQDAGPAAVEPTPLAGNLLHLPAYLRAVRRAFSPDRL